MGSREERRGVWVLERRGEGFGSREEKGRGVWVLEGKRGLVLERREVVSLRSSELGVQFRRERRKEVAGSRRSEPWALGVSSRNKSVTKAEQ